MRKKKTKKKKDGEEAVFQSGGASSRRAAKFKSLSRGDKKKNATKPRDKRLGFGNKCTSSGESWVGHFIFWPLSRDSSY